MSSLQSFSNLVVKETATLTWTIDDFDHVQEARSLDFSPINSVHQFRLELGLKNHAFGLDRVFLELSYNKHEKHVPLCYRVSLLDADEEKHYTKEYFWYYHENDYGLCQYNVTSYIPLNKCLGLAVDGALMIYCEVDILGENSVPPPSPSVIESFRKLSGNYETLFESGKWTDFVLTSGDKQFHVHKMILATRSRVFAAMFEDHETKEVKDGRLVIDDVATNVFELIIRYIYTGKVASLDEHAAELFIAAEKYQLDYLKSVCEQSLISRDSFSTLTAESACAVLLISDMHNAEQLKSKCIEYIVDNWNDVKVTKCWKEEFRGKRADLIEEILDFRYQ